MSGMFLSFLQLFHLDPYTPQNTSHPFIFIILPHPNNNTASTLHKTRRPWPHESHAFTMVKWPVSITSCDTLPHSPCSSPLGSGIAAGSTRPRHGRGSWVQADTSKCSWTGVERWGMRRSSMAGGSKTASLRVSSCLSQGLGFLSRLLLFSQGPSGPSLLEKSQTHTHRHIFMHALIHLPSIPHIRPSLFGQGSGVPEKFSQMCWSKGKTKQTGPHTRTDSQFMYVHKCSLTCNTVGPHNHTYMNSSTWVTTWNSEHNCSDFKSGAFWRTAACRGRAFFYTVYVPICVCMCVPSPDHSTRAAPKHTSTCVTSL